MCRRPPVSYNNNNNNNDFDLLWPLQQNNTLRIFNWPAKSQQHILLNIVAKCEWGPNSRLICVHVQINK